MQTVSFSIRPLVDTQGTPAQVGLALTQSNLIRIKNGYIQKLPGCVQIGSFLYGEGMDVLTGWVPNNNPLPFLAGSDANSTQVFYISTAYDITADSPSGVGSSQALWGDWLLWTAHGQTIYYWIPTVPPTGMLLPITDLLTIPISSGTYNNGTGTVVLTLSTPTSLIPGQTFIVSGLTGTGSVGLLDGTQIATAVEATAVTFVTGPGAGSITITGGTFSGPNVPTAVDGIFVAAPQQQAFAWGVYSTTIMAQDPLLLAWCDVGNLQDWTPTVSNQAGSFKLSSGSLIVAGTWFVQIGLIWTDIELWAMNYIGFPLVYSFNRIGENCGLIGQNAWGTLGTMVAWMSYNDFYMYQGGAVQPIPCSVRDFVFNSLDRGLTSAIHCDVNTYGDEFMWRFPQKGSQGKCTGYVKWSPAENNAWDFGQGLPNISSWANTSLQYTPTEFPGYGPVGTDYSGNILQFETDTAWNGSALDSFYITGWFYLAEGQEQIFVERVMPDFAFNPEPGFLSSAPGTMQMTFYFADEIPSDNSDYPIRTYGPYTVTQTTPYVIVRGRGRVMQTRIDCTDAHTFYRNGKHMARVSIDGRAF